MLDLVSVVLDDGIRNLEKDTLKDSPKQSLKMKKFTGLIQNLLL